MMDFIAKSRSNYFRVLPGREMDFKERMVALGLNFDSKQYEGEETVGYVMIWPELGDWPSTVPDEDGNDDIEVDIVSEVRQYLMPGQVVILHTIGYEGLRYLNHAMVAFTTEGVVLHQSQENFYEQLGKLGYEYTRAEQ